MTQPRYPRRGEVWKPKGGQLPVTIVSTYGGWSDNYDDDITVSNGHRQWDVPWSKFRRQFTLSKEATT